jgi:hypothetical protein
MLRAHAHVICLIHLLAASLVHWILWSPSKPRHLFMHGSTTSSIRMLLFFLLPPIELNHTDRVFSHSSRRSFFFFLYLFLSCSQMLHVLPLFSKFIFFCFLRKNSFLCFIFKSIFAWHIFVSFIKFYFFLFCSNDLFPHAKICYYGLSTLGLFHSRTKMLFQLVGLKFRILFSGHQIFVPPSLIFCFSRTKILF